MDGQRSSGAEFARSRLPWGLGAMDIEERWFLVAAATSIVVLLGLGLMSL